jgi:uncharacterized caspase-like protein
MTKKAVLVGINRYRFPGADLRGCVNDVRAMGGLLRETFGFEAEDIVTLADHDATKSRIQRELETLVAESHAGDALLFHYSGHGSNVPDKDGDEADYRDEILCPTDLDWKDPLLDDWLRDLFDTAPEGVQLAVILDCCHSSTATRAPGPPAVEDSIPRYLPCPLDILAEESGRALRGSRRGKRQSSPRSSLGADVYDVDIPEVLITGCRDDQTSADAFLGGDYRGALTYYLVNAAKAAGGPLSYSDLHGRIRNALRPTAFSQVPQLEGRAANLNQTFLRP